MCAAAVACLVSCAMLGAVGPERDHHDHRLAANVWRASPTASRTGSRTHWCRVFFFAAPFACVIYISVVARGLLLLVVPDRPARRTVCCCGGVSSSASPTSVFCVFLALACVDTVVDIETLHYFCVGASIRAFLQSRIPL